MSRQHHYYGANPLHYITTSTYRRAPVFDSERFKLRFTSTFDQLRTEPGFKINGDVLMPEHCRRLIWPSEHANPSRIMQTVEERTAKFILKNLRENLQCRKMLGRFRLPASVHHHAKDRVWQRKFYDLNIWSEKKRLEKLNYMHNNPLKRGLVNDPGEWPWSSWRFYNLGDASTLSMDPMP
ncbi:MAG TPA: transposase [Terriglobia bacterium]